MHAEPLHRPVAAGDRTVRHGPHHHRGALWHERDEVPECVVSGAGLWHRKMRLGLCRVHEVGELHCVLDKEDRDVVADQIPVAFVGIELDGEAADIARRVGRAAFAEHRREPHEHGGALAGLGKDGCAGQLVERLEALEEPVRGGAACVHDPFGYALVIEVGDLFPEDEILEQRRATQAGLERTLIVAYGDRKSTRLNSSHSQISYAVFCLKKKTISRWLTTY